jgi:hypothetical protein
MCCTGAVSRSLPALLLVAAVVMGGCGDGSDDPDGDEARTDDAAVVEVDGVEVFEDLTNDHVEGEVDYDQAPPVGGDHDEVWLNCDAYDVPVPDENAVHALEHGVVWLAHDPDLPAADVEVLHDLHADRPDRLIVSPYPDLEAPVVAVAWGRRLEVDAAEDPRLEEFVETYVDGPDAPEPGATCQGGLGLAD